MTSKKQNSKAKILVLFYSFTGNTAKLAEEVAVGARSVAGAEVEIKQVPEMLEKSFYDEKPALKKIRRQLDGKYQIATIEDMETADGIAFGTPTHFGSFASQLKQFIDQLSGDWLKGRLVSKPAAVFCSSGSLHGGEELTLLSLMIPLFNLGMIPVGIPYPIQSEGPGFDAGSPYGAIYVAKGGKDIAKEDKKAARVLGIRLAAMAKLMKCGCEHCGICYDLMKKQ